MIKKRNKLIVIGLIILFSILGYMTFLYGLKNGQQISSILTKPTAQSTFWTTSVEQRNVTMYGICMLGGLWIIISHVLFVLYIYKNFIKSDETNK